MFAMDFPRGAAVTSRCTLRRTPAAQGAAVTALTDNRRKPGIKVSRAKTNTEALRAAAGGDVVLLLREVRLLGQETTEVG